MLKALKVSSLTSYNYLYAYDLSKAGWPTADYAAAIKANADYWPKMSAQLDNVPFFPNVTMGWDVTPRLVQTDKFDRYKGYPWTPVFNVTGQPAMSAPLHWNDEGLPIGMHFVGKWGDEGTLFRLAGQLEKAKPWFDKVPGDD